MSCSDTAVVTLLLYFLRLEIRENALCIDIVKLTENILLEKMFLVIFSSPLSEGGKRGVASFQTD